MWTSIENNSMERRNFQKENTSVEKFEKGTKTSPILHQNCREKGEKLRDWLLTGLIISRARLNCVNKLVK